MFESIGHGMTIASILERVKYTFEWQHFRVALSRVRLSKTFHCGIKLAVWYSWLTSFFFLLQRTSCNCFYIAESSSDDVALIVWRLIWFHIYSCSFSAIFSPKSPITQCLSHDCFLFVTVIFLAKKSLNQHLLPTASQPLFGGPGASWDGDRSNIGWFGYCESIKDFHYWDGWSVKDIEYTERFPTSKSLFLVVAVDDPEPQPWS